MHWNPKEIFKRQEKTDKLEVNPKNKTYTVQSNPDEHKNINEVLHISPDKTMWMDAIKSELYSIEENKKWTEV